ncbi:MAG: ATP synthase F1 subunit delta, partial [Dehalococcoidia bacterium]
MAFESVGRRYAQAAFAIALEKGNVPVWRAGLADVATVLAGSAAAPVLADSRVPLERRLRVVERALDLDPLVLNLAKLLVTKGRSMAAPAIAAAFNRLADAHEGIAQAEIVSAVALSDAEVARIE